MAVFAVHAPRDMRGSSKRGRLNDGVEEGVEGALVLAFACRKEQATGAGEVGGWCPCLVATSRTRVALGRISPSTWRATKWSARDADLGRIWTEFGQGPKMKFVVLVRLYIFRLSVMVIRFTD